jgi:hypothetical protein
LFVPSEFYWYIQSIWETRFISERELKEYFKTMGHDEALSFLDDTMLRAFKPMEFDYSKSCIFVIGNIDEAYQMSSNFNPDSDADRFYKHSLKITMPKIKSALQKRFRAEQIARLGNSQIIYPAFSSKVYRELISLELNKLVEKIKKEYDIDIDFHESVNTIVYKEGVLPTQGARPVFTTMNSLVESYVGKIVEQIIETKGSVKKVAWRFIRGQHKVELINKKGEVLSTSQFPVKLKIESLRKTANDEMQAHVAIHEAGHAIAAIYGAQILPTEILSRTANMSEGYCTVELPSIDTRDTLEKYIIIALGGFVAEKMIFGEENLGVGTGGDFESATSVALSMAKTFGMLDTIPMFYGHKSTSTNTMFNTENVKSTEQAARKLIGECEEKCEKILKENKFLLLKIGEYLSTHSRMDAKKIKKFIDDFGKPVILKDKDKYHTFKQRIADALAEEDANGGARKTLTQRYGEEQGNVVMLESNKKKKDD